MFAFVLITTLVPVLVLVLQGLGLLTFHQRTLQSAPPDQSQTLGSVQYVLNNRVSFRWNFPRLL